MTRILNFIKYWWPAVYSKFSGPFAISSGKQLLRGLREFSVQAVRSNSDFDGARLQTQGFDDLAAQNVYELGTLTFRLQGIEDVAIKLGDELKNLVGKLKGDVDSSKQPSEVDSLPVVWGNTSMSALIGDGAPIANVRSGEDAGMIDFYNVDNFYPEAKILLEAAMASGVHEFLNKISGKSLKFKSINAYVNSGVTRTRGFHVDAYGVTQYKMFIYLTDVLDLDSGPYCYVLGSKNDRGMEKVNRFLARLLGLTNTDLTLIDFKNAVPILGQSGTVIVSDQGGAHRGLPQSPDGFRAICVLNFFAT